MSVTTVFRWTFSAGTSHRAYAEAALRKAGEPTDPFWYLDVDLVHDADTAPIPGAPLDPAARAGRRVHVGCVRDRDQCRLLAHLAPIEGQQLAYKLTVDLLLNRPGKVAEFADPALTTTLEEIDQCPPFRTRRRA